MKRGQRQPRANTPVSHWWRLSQSWRGIKTKAPAVHPATRRCGFGAASCSEAWPGPRVNASWLFFLWDLWKHSPALVQRRRQPRRRSLFIASKNCCVQSDIFCTLNYKIATSCLLFILTFRCHQRHISFEIKRKKNEDWATKNGNVVHRFVCLFMASTP